MILRRHANKHPNFSRWIQINDASLYRDEDIWPNLKPLLEEQRIVFRWIQASRAASREYWKLFL